MRARRRTHAPCIIISTQSERAHCYVITAQEKDFSENVAGVYNNLELFRMECGRLVDNVTPRRKTNFDCEDGDDDMPEWMEFMDDTPPRNVNTSHNAVFGHGYKEGESSPCSFSGSSGSGSNQCEEEHGNSPGLNLPLRHVIRRRLTVKQRPPLAYRKHKYKMRGVKADAESKGFAIAKNVTKQERKQLHNRSYAILMETLIQTVGKDKIRDCQKWGRMRERARVWWSRLNVSEKKDIMLTAKASVKPGSLDEKAIKFGADGMNTVKGKHQRGGKRTSAAERVNRNCRYKSKAILVTYHSRSLVIAISDEWRGLSDSLLVQRLKREDDVLQLIDIAGKDVHDMQTALAAIEWSASLELCIETWLTEHECRLHLHFVGVRPEGFRYTDGARTPELHLQRLDIKPSHMKGCVDPSTGKRTKTTGSLHYYCQMPKKGVLATWTNHVAFKDFLVSPRWIISFVQRGKMTHEDAKKVTVFFIFEEDPPPHTCIENHSFSPIPLFNIFWACLVHKMYSLLR